MRGKQRFLRRVSLYSLPAVFFWIMLSMVTEFCYSLISPETYRLFFGTMEYSILFLYVISFTGSAILLYSCREKKSYWKYILPFSIVTASGALFCIIKLLYSGTPYEWPLVPVTQSLFSVCNLSVAPAITLLLVPFVKVLKSPPQFFFGCIVVISAIMAVLVMIILITDILPLFDPEFVWSKFWDFGIGNMWIDIYYEIYLILGMPSVGLLSVFIIHDYLKNNPSEGGS